MPTSVYAAADGEVGEVLAGAGSSVDAGDLLCGCGGEEKTVRLRLCPIHEGFLATFIAV